MTQAEWYPDSVETGGQQYWDGYGWTDHHAPPSGGRGTAKSHWRQNGWVWIIVVTVAALLAILFFYINTTSTADRWSGFPRTLSCQTDAPETSDPGRWVDVPAAIRATQVTMSHPSDQVLRLEIEFAKATPDRRGISYALNISPNLKGSKSPVLVLDSPQRGQRYWKVDASTIDSSDQNRLISANKSRSTVILEINIDGLDKLLGRKFTPSVGVVYFHRASPKRDYTAETCNW